MTAHEAAENLNAPAGVAGGAGALFSALALLDANQSAAWLGLIAGAAAACVTVFNGYWRARDGSEAGKRQDAEERLKAANAELESLRRLANEHASTIIELTRQIRVTIHDDSPPEEKRESVTRVVKQVAKAAKKLGVATGDSGQTKAVDADDSAPPVNV